MGLIPNRAAYRIVPIKSGNAGSEMAVSRLRDNPKEEETIFKIHSSLPSFWVGTYSVLSKEKLPNLYQKGLHDINMEKDFLATYYEISNCFSKFYIAPDYKNQVNQGHVLETSINVAIKTDNPHYFFELELGRKGNVNLNIELPRESAIFKKKGDDGQTSTRYASVKYFLTKLNPAT